MNCPSCPDRVLEMTDRAGIEIDYCPTCRGVWLDRGELDKIIDRTAASYSPAPTPATSRPDTGDRRDAGRTDDRWSDERNTKPKRRKREGFLGELFEF